MSLPVGIRPNVHLLSIGPPSSYETVPFPFVIMTFVHLLSFGKPARTKTVSLPSFIGFVSRNKITTIFIFDRNDSSGEGFVGKGLEE